MGPTKINDKTIKNPKAKQVQNRQYSQIDNSLEIKSKTNNHFVINLSSKNGKLENNEFSKYKVLDSIINKIPEFKVKFDDNFIKDDSLEKIKNKLIVENDENINIIEIEINQQRINNVENICMLFNSLYFKCCCFIFVIRRLQFETRRSGLNYLIMLTHNYIYIQKHEKSLIKQFKALYYYIGIYTD